MSTVHRKKLLTGPILLSAAKDSLVKLNPVTLMKNPVMFVVEVGTVIVLLMVLAPGYFHAEHAVGFNITVFFILLFTVLFANFAEALAEGRGKAQADSLKKTKQDITANKLAGSGVKQVPASELRKGDIVVVSQGELIPGDGEVTEGWLLWTNRPSPGSRLRSLRKPEATSAP